MQADKDIESQFKQKAFGIRHEGVLKFLLVVFITKPQEIKIVRIQRAAYPSTSCFPVFFAHRTGRGLIEFAFVDQQFLVSPGNQEKRGHRRQDKSS